MMTETGLVGVVLIVFRSERFEIFDSFLAGNFKGELRSRFRGFSGDGVDSLVGGS